MLDASARSRSEAAATFLAALDRFAPGRAALILAHFDADGLSAAAILARSLARVGRPAQLRILGKGENPWSAATREEVALGAPGGLIIADLGVGEGDVLPGTPTLVIDHHVPRGTPGAAVVLSGHGSDPEPTTSLLAYWCAQAIGPADDLLWLAAMKGYVGGLSV